MEFSVLIPARMASSRLPNKPLADIAGKPMIVRVAEVAAQAGANQVVVATDSPEVLQAVEAAGYQGALTRADHLSGTDRLAEAADLLNIPDEQIIVNLQGDEPLMPAEVCRQVADTLAGAPESVMSTAGHAIHSAADLANPNIVKVVCRRDGQALYFSRAPIPYHRDGQAGWPDGAPTAGPLRHVGIYAYRARFLRLFPKLAPAPIELAESLEQLRALWHGHAISVVCLENAPPAGVDTPADLAVARAAFAP